MKEQKYYTAGTQTIAVRTIQNRVDTLQWLISDQINSTSVTANADGTWNSEIRYTAFGEVRFSSGITPTNYRYTGQLAQKELGLDYYVARFYDPYLNHWIQPDSIIPDPGQAKSFDRYAYVQNNPIRYNDPSGHDVGCPGRDASECRKPLLQTISPDDNTWGGGGGGGSGGVKITIQVGRFGEIPTPEVPGSSISPKSVANEVTVVTAILESINKSGIQSKVIPVAVPNDFGWDTITRYTTPSLRRNFLGGAEKYINPVGIIAGWGLNVLPNQINDFKNNAPISRMKADFDIDNTGFLLSTGSGLAVAAGTRNPVYGAGSDILSGIFFDNFIETHHVRENLTDLYAKQDQQADEFHNKILPFAHPFTTPVPPGW